MEHVLHFSLPGSGHPKHGESVPVLDTVPLAMAVPQGQPGETNSERDSPEWQRGYRCPSREPLQPLKSPCWGRYLHCSCAVACAGAGYALKEVQPIGSTHSGAGLSWKTAVHGKPTLDPGKSVQRKVREDQPLNPQNHPVLLRRAGDEGVKLSLGKGETAAVKCFSQSV